MRFGAYFVQKIPLDDILMHIMMKRMFLAYFWFISPVDSV